MMNCENHLTDLDQIAREGTSHSTKEVARRTTPLPVGLEQDLQILLLPRDPKDNNNAFIEFFFNNFSASFTHIFYSGFLH